MKAPADLENLPQELKDLIVDHISQISDDRERIQTLCSTALVSRRFRYWAHKRLFATVVLRGRHGKAPTALIRRLNDLSELIQADPHSEKTGIASHIRSFTLSLGGHRSYVVPLLEEDSLPIILQKIHRAGSRPRSLSILLFMPGDNDQLDWMSMSHELRRALVGVSRSTLLTTLRLRGIRNLPRDILAGSSVGNIKFNNISIKDYNHEDCGRITPPSPPFGCGLHCYGLQSASDVSMQVGSGAASSEASPVVPSALCLPVFSATKHSTQTIAPPSGVLPSSEGKPYPDALQLESIETDHTFPILHLLDFSPTLSNSKEKVFKRLRNLTMNIKDTDGFRKTAEIFETAPFVEKLEIKLNCTSIGQDALSLRLLHNLKHLRLIHRLPTPGFSSSSNHPTRPHTTIQDMLNILTYSELPKTLRRISITLALKPIYRNYFYVMAPQRSPAAAAADQGGLGTETLVHQSNGEVSGATLTTTGAAMTHSNVIATTTDNPISLPSPNPQPPTVIVPPTATIIKRVFAACPYHNILKPFDDLFGYSASHFPDRFADINYYTIRLEVDLYLVPKEFTRSREREFAEEAAEYVKSHFFPKLNERFERMDEVSAERRYGGGGGGGGGGFGVVVTPRFRSSA